MQFISITFMCFFFLFFIIYHITKKEYRYIILFIANYIFYGWNNIAAIPTLFLATLITYIGGIVLEGKKTKLLYTIFFMSSLSILVIYKYLNFLIDNVNILSGIIEPAYAGIPILSKIDIVVPIGLSFFIFQSTSYLNDVYRKGMKAEKNFLRYAAFVSFFPTILSGPIQKSRDLLPQLTKSNDFDYTRAKQGVELLVWGFFQKIVIANRLGTIVNTVYDDYLAYDNIYYIIAAVCYSFYIYCDFSSYSDMACGVAQILGFDVKPNFKNPYLAESIGEFWNRWHISLNAWFVENVYIPLGGKRKGTLIKYRNMFLVFFFSGIWHGASWNFIIWGVLNGILRIFGDVLQPLRIKVCDIFKINADNYFIRIIKKAFVFGLITLTWVFFRVSDINVAIHIIKNMVLLYPRSLFNPEVLQIFGGNTGFGIFCVLMGIFIILQCVRREGGKIREVLKKMPEGVENIIIAIFISCCIIMACSGTTTFNTQFIYFQF